MEYNNFESKEDFLKQWAPSNELEFVYDNKTYFACHLEEGYFISQILTENDKKRCKTQKELVEKNIEMEKTEKSFSSPLGFLDYELGEVKLGDVITEVKITDMFVRYEGNSTEHPHPSVPMNN